VSSLKKKNEKEILRIYRILALLHRQVNPVDNFDVWRERREGGGLEAMVCSLIPMFGGGVWK